MSNGIFVEKITEIEVENGGVAIYLVNGGSLLMSVEWFNRYTPAIGDFLTQCYDGFISVCPAHAMNAIKQVVIDDLSAK